jgi:RimJ/RimL family protein N-acetyltransferase
VHKLPENRYFLAKPLFQPLDHHLAVEAILDKAAPGTIYVDDPAQPSSALIWNQMRCYLAGSPRNAVFNYSLHGLFADTIHPSLLSSGKPMLIMYFESEEWEKVVDDLVPGKHMAKGRRQSYERHGSQREWRAQLPEGFALRQVDETLLGQKQLRNLDSLEEEMCSERPTVQEFLARSFGVFLLHGDEIVGWCLSEYNRPERCEVGIEILETYRRRGLGTLMSLAFVDLAFSRGVTRIGWHCWATNEPSVATALKAGFQLVQEYPAYYTWLKE